MSECADCKGKGCVSCGNRGHISDCKAKEHWAEIDGKKYPVELDPGSRTHRFPMNRIVRDLIDHAQEGKKFGFNQIAQKHGMNEYTTEELLQFYMLIGYSVGGIAELDFFMKLEMDTCEWKKEVEAT